MFEPFADEPANRGLLSERNAPEHDARSVNAGRCRGLQLAHTCDRRPRYLYGFLISSADIETEHVIMISALHEHGNTWQKKICAIFQTHVIASMQPYHDVDDGAGRKRV